MATEDYRPVSAQTEFENRREMPPEWPALLADAQRIIDSSAEEHTVSAHLAPANITAMHERLAALDDETLEHNRYYALSEAIPPLMRRVCVPSRYDSMIDWGADCMIDGGAVDVSRRGVIIDKIAGPRATGWVNPVEEAALEAVAEFSPAERLLAESLFAAQIARSQKDAATAEVMFALQTRGHSFMAESLATNLFSGAGGVLRLILKHHNGAPGAVLAETIEPLDLAKLAAAHHTLFSGLAQVRNDEIKRAGDPTSPLGQAITARTTPAETKVDFDRTFLKSEPQTPAGDNAPLHTERLVCPAFQVPGAIRIAAGGMAHMTELANKRAATGRKNVDPLEYDYLNDWG